MRHHAGIVEDHVDAAMLLDRGIDQPEHLLRIGDIGDHGRRLPARSCDVVDQ